MMQMLICPGLLFLGCDGVSEEAHLSAVGNAIRMVLAHFVELKRCPAARQIAFRKAGLFVCLVLES